MKRITSGYACCCILGTLLMGLSGGIGHAQTPNDRNRTLDFILERATLSEVEQNRLDINKDGVIDVADLIYQVNQSSGFPIIEFLYADTAVSESGGVVTVELRASRSFTGQVGLAVAGTAVGGTDYEPFATSVDFNGRSASVSVPIINNDAPGGDRTILLAMFDNPFAGYITRGNAQHVIDIKDDDGGAIRAFFVHSASSQVEDFVTAPIDIGFTRPFTGRLNYTVNGTAEAGSDYLALPGFIEVGGTTQIAIPVEITSDFVTETPETVVLTLAAPGAETYEIVAPAAHTLTINELATQFINGSTTVQEDAGEIAIPIRFALPFTGTVNYSVETTGTPGEDFIDLGGGTIDVDGFEAAIVLDISDDLVAEPTESVRLVLQSNAGFELGAPYTHTLFINDNDRTWRGNLQQSLAQIDIELNLLRQGDSVTGSLVSNGGAGLPAGEYPLESVQLSDTAFKAKVAPIPVEAGATLAGTDFLRTIELDSFPGLSGDIIEPNLITGAFIERIEATEPTKAYYNRTIQGAFTLVLKSPEVPLPEVELLP